MFWKDRWSRARPVSVIELGTGRWEAQAGYV